VRLPGRWTQSLGFRLALAAAGVLLILQVIGVLVYRRGVDERRAAELENTVALGRTAAAVAEAFAEGLERVTLAAALALGRQEGPLDQSTAGPYLRSLLTDYPQLRALFLTDLDGRVIASDSGAGVGTDLAGRPYVAELRRGAPAVWSGNLAGMSSGADTVAFGRPVLGPDGQPRALLVVAFYARRLAEGLPLALPADAEVAVLDDSGRLVYSSGIADLDALPDEVRDVSEAPGVAAALGGSIVPLQGAETPLPGRARFGVLVPVQRPRWVLALTRPQAPLEAALRWRFLQEAGAIAVVVLAAAAVQALLVRRLTRPLSTLAGAARTVARGERLPVDGLPVSSAGAEVGQLAAAMQTMDAAVAEREARLRDEALTLETLNRTGQLIGGELDLQRLVQAVTDAATTLAAARFGAFFYNLIDERGESYTLYTISGVPHEAFASFPMPRNTAIFEPTFRGTGVLRLDDVTLDPRYGKNAPYAGMPPGHLPVRSYLAVPVVARGGAVLGGLFFGHPEPGVFTERAERLVVGLAAQAAVGLDNARLYQEAQRAVRLREEFLAVAAHELKTPITALQGTAQLQLRRLRRRAASGGPGPGDPGDDTPAALENIVYQSRRLTRLVEELLDVTRLEQGRLVLHREPTDLAALTRRSVEATPALRDQPERFPVCLDAPQPVPAEVDSLRLEQVLTNLLDNATKYSPEGGAIDVEVSAPTAETARIAVRDRGLGIPRDERERVFERFQRAHAGAPGAAGPVAGGLGLGLYVAQQIVHLHGGTIGVESPEDGGGGTRVVVTLQRSAPHGDGADARYDGLPAGAGGTGAARGRDATTQATEAIGEE
jgi:signal transduction histidine kinase